MAFVHLEDQDRTLEVVVFQVSIDTTREGTWHRHRARRVLDQNDQGIKVKATRFLPSILLPNLPTNQEQDCPSGNTRRDDIISAWVSSRMGCVQKELLSQWRPH